MSTNLTYMLTNEITHEPMHQNGNRPQDKAILELEAESVAYVIASDLPPKYVPVIMLD